MTRQSGGWTHRGHRADLALPRSLFRGMPRARRRAAIALSLGMLASIVTPAGSAGPDRDGALVAVGHRIPCALRDDGEVGTLRQALSESLRWLAGQPSDRAMTFGPRALTVAEQVRPRRRMLDLLADAPAPDVLEARVLAEFDLLRSAGRDDGAMLVTGYHEPIVDAADSPSAEFRVPILGVPRDLYARRRGP